jgi:hypothetical protein
MLTCAYKRKDSDRKFGFRTRTSRMESSQTSALQDSVWQLTKHKPEKESFPIMPGNIKIRSLLAQGGRLETWVPEARFPIVIVPNGERTELMPIAPYPDINGTTKRVRASPEGGGKLGPCVRRWKSQTCKPYSLLLHTYLPIYQATAEPKHREKR